MCFFLFQKIIKKKKKDMLQRTQFSFVRSRASIIPRQTQPLEKRLTPTRITPKYGKKDPELKLPYVVRPFQKDGHIASLQHIENRGMYKEEIDIERARLPKANKTVTIHTDGSLAEREYEFAVPPVSVVFRDRHSVYLEDLAEARRLSSEDWRSARAYNVPVCKAPKEDHERKLNILCFPYSVPTKLPLRGRPIVTLKGNDAAMKPIEVAVGEK
jgi:hypothetical protein